MKISDRNTVLHLLTDNCEVSFTANETDPGIQESIYLFFNEEFVNMRQAFARKIQYICKPFLDAFNLAGKKKAFRFCREPVEQSGTLIMPSLSSAQLTTFYTISASPDANGEWLVDCTIIAFFTYKDLDQPLLAAVIRRGETLNANYVDKNLQKGGLTPENLIDRVLCLNIFMRYCEVETKIVPPGKKAFHASQKYVNETKSPIEVMDATWFTTFIRSEEFAVGANTGGFFRLQPCGKNLKDRKLIWVFPFTKHGYIRKAKVLSDPERKTQ
jgi:hypothetical protein